MKTKLTAFALLFLVTIGVNAQIDRSKQPKAGPEPEISLKTPKEFSLKNGLKVLVVENHKLPRVSYSLRIDNNPIATGDKAGLESILGSMLGNGTTTISKDDFNEEIDFLGARLSFGFSGGYASSLSKYSDRILELMADAAINPLLTEEEFEKEKTKLIENLKQGEKSIDDISSRVGNALAYGTKHPYGEFTTEETINNVAFGDALAFYEKYFNPNHAYLVVIGDVEFKSIKKQIEKHFSKWDKSVDITTGLPKVNPNAQYTQINFVDLPSASQSSITIMNNVDLKMNDEDYHAALITNNILGGGGEGYLFKNLREEHGYTYGAYSSLRANRYGAGRFTATAKVRAMVTDSAVVEALKEINRIKTEPVDAELLANAKAKYVGNFIMGLESPQTVANYALNIKLNDLPKDFYATYLQKINDVSAEDIMRVANKYFKSENARVLIVGKGSDVIENLEKTGIPIKYYDAYANPVEKPVFSKPLPAGLTAETVLNNYVTAIGGEANLNKINTILINSNVTIPGAPYKPTAVRKQMAPNKFSMELNIEGMGTVMKQSFNGETGYQEGQGQKRPMDEKALASSKAEKGLFPELHMDASRLELESVMTIEGSDVYKVKVTKGDVVSYRYYDTKTSYLLRTEETTEMGGQTITTVTDYANYKEVDGVMLPNTMKLATGPQVLSFENTEMKINEGVTEADFN
ncbi:insulinase family protein [Winogradskyella psychrotolerans]|uniref:insulinase family protein n=1 Tax=Winogradskyella psychrotolerans TaxID=1344585 RepID=UPI001C078D64|nr:insulinase family protein [Winogradskyella psychrotolerans]MBU2928171.1 insulinase family protein [Winogradskyella psychrotolerans]